MKKTFNKVKLYLSAIGVAIISFFSKVLGQWNWYVPSLYGVEYNIGIDSIEQPTLIDTIIKLAKRPLIGITFIIWIINFLKIRKIKDKKQKKKKIKSSIITVAILIILIIACVIIPLLTKKNYENNTIYEIWNWSKPEIDIVDIIKWIFVWVTLLIGILYIIRAKKIKDKIQKRKEIISTIILVILIVTYLVLAR